jgi:antitoxin (DNA-binding transcriptional repressor) of toxin-antitoxin stability system
MQLFHWLPVRSRYPEGGPLLLSRGLNNRGIIVTMATVYIPENEAARDFPGLLARVRAGEEIVIEKPDSPAVVLRVAEEPRGRLLSASILLAEAHAKELGYEARMDPEFAADLEEIIRNRKPRDTSAWD